MHSNKILDLFSLTRPLEWSKQFANMTIGYFTALFLSGLIFKADIPLFLAAFIIIGPLFWGGLYVLNDWTDWKFDQKHSAKKQRAVAAGKIRPVTALVFGSCLVVLSFALGFLLNNPLLLVCMAIMLINQWFYTIEPFYLKRRLFFDMLSGAIINPVFRFLSGWAIVTQTIEGAPLTLILFVVAIQYVFYSLFRLSSRKLEKELGFTSTVVILKEKTIMATTLIAFFIAVIAYTYSCTQVLGEKFLIPLLLSGAMLPRYAKAMEHPEHLQFKKMKRIVYLHFIGFAILFAAMFFI
jgi:4-hydroxybenzoate polyprenyltransferase